MFKPLTKLHKDDETIQMFVLVSLKQIRLRGLDGNQMLYENFGYKKMNIENWPEAVDFDLGYKKEFVKMPIESKVPKPTRMTRSGTR